MDIVFYDNDEPQAVDLAAWRTRRRGGWVDPHSYHVYYTGSQDGGRTFTTPQQLNAAPIVGSRFVRTSRIDTQGAEGTQAVVARIER